MRGDGLFSIFAFILYIGMEQEVLRQIDKSGQSFAKMRRQDKLYIDKTALVHRLVSEESCVFLSRPKRFGKSLLADTLACYFEGRRELFAGTAMEGLETQWAKHPVVRLEHSGCTTAKLLSEEYDNTFSLLEAKHHIVPPPQSSLRLRFKNLILSLAEKYGEEPVVLIDEFDYPLQQTALGTPEREAVTAVMRPVFDQLKPLGSQLRFVFITGIARFARATLLSCLNNLVDISFLPEYQALCGITQAELDGPVLRPYVLRLANKWHWSLDETSTRLKQFYDGYHFCQDMDQQTVVEDIYNPYSLLRALSLGRIKEYWDGGSATELHNAMPSLANAEQCDGATIDADVLERSDIASTQSQLFLYQMGVLTLRSYADGIYTLRFPNLEVRRNVAEAQIAELLPLPDDKLKAKAVADARQARFHRLRQTLMAGDLTAACEALAGIVADFNFSGISREALQVEERYRDLLDMVLYSQCLYHETEHHTEGGVADMAVWTDTHIYVLEFKRRREGGARAAAAQIAERGYLSAYRGMLRRVVGVGLGVGNEGTEAVEFETVPAPWEGE